MISVLDKEITALPEVDSLNRSAVFYLVQDGNSRIATLQEMAVFMASELGLAETADILQLVLLELQKLNLAVAAATEDPIEDEDVET